MASLKHCLGRLNSKKQCLIFLQYFHHQRRIIFSSKLHIDPKLWDSKNTRVKPAHPEYILMNEVLKAQSSGINHIILQCRLNKQEPTCERIRHLYKLSEQDSKDILSVFSSFIKEIEPSITKSTIKIYDNVAFYLKSFIRSAKESPDWDNINESFMERLAGHMMKKGLSNATIKRNISYLNSFLKYAHHKGILKNLSYLNYKIKVPKKDIISLTEEELRSITSLKLPENLARVRDAFVFCSLTGGIRYSDLRSVTKEHIFETGAGYILKLVAQKTKTPTSIPVLPEAYEILQRRKFNLVSVSHQRYLKLIKKVCLLAGITQVIEVVEFKGSNRIEKKVPKCELINSHTARKTFITLSLNKGIPIQVVAAITHNGNLNTIMRRYAVISDEDKLSIFNKAWSIKAHK